MNPIISLPARHPDSIIPESHQDAIQPFFTGTMPLPPSVNMAYKIVHLGRLTTIGPSHALEQFKKDAALTLLQATCDQAVLQAIREANAKKKHVPLSVSLDCFFHTMWKRDLDGPLKFAIDAAFTHLGLNDNQVLLIFPVKLVDARAPRIDIAIRCIAQ